jgi:hypothetical protein
MYASFYTHRFIYFIDFFFMLNNPNNKHAREMLCLVLLILPYLETMITLINLCQFCFLNGFGKNLRIKFKKLVRVFPL